MSIDSDLQAKASITEGDALDLFTGRYSFTRLLAEHINEPPSEKILFFHGAGGNGKSLLLKYLQKNICKRLMAEQWQQIKGKPDSELQAVLKDWPETAHLPVPSALLDFTGPQNTDSFYGLINIRQMLTQSVRGTPYKLRFPLHTYGCFLYLKKTNRLHEKDDLFRFEEIGLVKDFLGLIQSLPAGVGIGISALKLVNKYSGKRLTHYKRRFGLNEQLVKKLQAMDAEKELRPLLPVLFAQDLQVAMERSSDKKIEEAPERVVLFFDTHEAFYGKERNRKTDFFRDGWLRRLLRELLPTPEVIIIVSGRDVPRWADADEYELDTAVEEKHICTVAVDSLSKADAEFFLKKKVGITDAEMRQSLLRYASERADAVHPLHLALCVEVVREAEQKGEPMTPQDFSEIPEFQKKSKYLIRKLLGDISDELEDAILALSACRSFDRALYMLLGKTLEFATNRALFKRLIRFSFIRQISQGHDQIDDGRYRIHDLIRRLGKSEEVAEAHKALQQYYESKNELEAIYHVNQLDWLRGIDLWGESFERCLTSSNYKACELLLNIRQELDIKSNLGRGVLADEEGKYLRTLTLYDAALKKFEEAIICYGAELNDNPQNTRAWHNKGNSLMNIAHLRTMLSQDNVASQQYKIAVSAFNEALRIWARKNIIVSTDFVGEGFRRYNSDILSTLNSKGLTLGSLAQLQFRHSQYEEAKLHYEAAIASLDEVIVYSQHKAISNPQGYLRALNNKCLALIGLADVQAKLPQTDAAEQTYEQAITYCKKALRQQHDYVKAEANMGHALMGWADLCANRAHYENARTKYKEAIAAFNRALSLSHNDVYALDSGGRALARLGQLQCEQFHDKQAALQSWHNALVLCQQSLTIAPNNPSTNQRRENLALLIDSLEVDSLEAQ